MLRAAGALGWLLAMLGQDVGFPVPRGGAQRLADALRGRLEAHGGQVRPRTEVTQVLVRGDRAVGVRTAGGDTLRATRAVLADVAAPALYRSLLDAEHLPTTLLHRLDRFQLDWPTLKLNWALGAAVPWTAAQAHGAGTVHLGVDDHGFVDATAALSKGIVPTRPFVLFGQMTTADSSRSPVGTESAWAYTHVPIEMARDAQGLADQVRRVEEAVERVAPGFDDLILNRTVQTPTDLERADANLLSGAINGGTAGDPPAAGVPTFHRHRTTADAYLRALPGQCVGAPGGGVHGACGWNAARAALLDAGPIGGLRRVLHRTAWARLAGRAFR